MDSTKTHESFQKTENRNEKFWVSWSSYQKLLRFSEDSSAFQGTFGGQTDSTRSLANFYEKKLGNRKLGELKISWKASSIPWALLRVRWNLPEVLMIFKKLSREPVSL